MYLFLAFLMVPLIEIALFIQVGGLIGLWPTLAIVVLTAILGTSLVRSQGRLAMGQLRSSFQTLSDPAEPLAHGAMILFAGALLLTPGFFTDAIGFALLMPPVRLAVFRYLSSRITVSQFEMGSMHGQGHPQDPRYSRRPDQMRGQGDVIDGDFEDVTPRGPADHPSGWVKGPE
ncbi:FxsA family protein [Phycobacter sp. K97]|uniref:FxsA family protein n=1 Tax=Phycobacter sedimenti TaxID=3133977 RepID=UPI00311DAFAC